MIEHHFCPTCFKNQYLSTSVIEHNGRLGKCLYCGTPMALHECSSNSGLGSTYWHIPLRIWLPFVKPLISAACPECGFVIKVGEQVESLPGIPAEVKEVASDLIKIGVVVGVAAVIANILKLLGKKKS